MNQHVKTGKPETLDLSRRGFIIGMGAAGMVCGFAPAAALAATQPATAFEPSIWYSVGADSIVTVNVAKADMGQHIASTMAQIVAEELGASWRDMRVVLASNDPKYADPVVGAIVTGGSWSTHMNFDAMSRAGAAGRIALIEAGAKLLGASADKCSARDSQIIDSVSGKSISFGKIVAGGGALKTLSADEMKAIKLKSFDEYTLIGQSVPQIDIPGKTHGAVKYGIDATLPGMVYGRPVTPPVRYGASVKSVDDSAAKSVKGYVRSVTLEDKTGSTTGWVVVVAETYYAAIQASNLIKVEYDLGPNAGASLETLFAEGKRLTDDPSTGQFWVKAGDAAAAYETAALKLEADYTTNIAIHNPLEPQNCLATIENGILHLYTGNQFFTLATGLTAAATGMDPKTIVMHQHFIGGGFGRRLDVDQCVVAALTTKALGGKPVKVIYSRETEMTMDFTRPSTYQRIRAGLDANGKLITMDHSVAGPWVTLRWVPGFMAKGADGKPIDQFFMSGADYWYTVPNQTARGILNTVAQAATPSGHLRSVGPAWTFWAGECMIDELAHAARQDPLQFRIGLLDGAGDNGKDAGAQRLRDTMLAAAALSGYGSTTLPKGEGFGIACVSAQDRATVTWTACVAHVAVDSDGNVKVKKLTVATDVGTAINPDGIRAQVEGAALWGVSLAMLEHATFANGAIQQTNFDTYKPLRMKDKPPVEVHIIAHGQPASGVGEPATTVVGPAIGNAIFNAVGARVRSLPITAAAVKAAMKA